MKQTLLIVGILSLSYLGVGTTPAHAHGVTQAKAAELSLHRLERLVILKKIEDSFQSKPASIKVELIAHQAETDPSFKSTISQVPGADGTQKRLEIVMDEEGKTLTHQVLTGTEAANAQVWPDKDAVTLTENSLHYVLDNAAVKPELVPFNDTLTDVSLSSGTNAAGNPVALVQIKASASASVLKVRIKLDGTFDSAEIVASEE